MPTNGQGSELGRACHLGDGQARVRKRKRKSTTRGSDWRAGPVRN